MVGTEVTARAQELEFHAAQDPCSISMHWIIANVAKDEVITVESKVGAATPTLTVNDGSTIIVQVA